MNVNNSDTSIIHNLRQNHPIISAPVDVIKQPLLFIHQTARIGFFLSYKVVTASTALVGALTGAIYGTGIVVSNLFKTSVENKFNFRPIYDYAISLSKTFSENALIPKLAAGIAAGGAVTALALPVFISPYFWGALACTVPLSMIDTAFNGKPKNIRQVFDGVWKYSDPYTYFNTPADDHEEVEEIREYFFPDRCSSNRQDKTKKREPFKLNSSESKATKPEHTEKPTLNITPESNLRPQPAPTNCTIMPNKQINSTKQLKHPPIHNSFQAGVVPLRIELPRYQPEPGVDRFCTLKQESSPKDAVVLCSDTGHEYIFSYKWLAKMARRLNRKKAPLFNPRTRQPYDWNQVFRVPANTIRQWLKEEKKSQNSACKLPESLPGEKCPPSAGCSNQRSGG